MMTRTVKDGGLHLFLEWPRLVPERKLGYDMDVGDVGRIAVVGAGLMGACSQTMKTHRALVVIISQSHILK
jgi:hypothetical protein